jgi:pre-mycofactocin synthase
MRRGPRFSSVAGAQRAAARRLPAPVYRAILAGAEQGLTRDGNPAAFAALRLAPRAIGRPAACDLATTVLGQPVALPVLCSPVGVQAVHPDGEVAVARAAAARGTALGLSSFASKPLADVVAANPRTFYQVCWAGGRAGMSAQLEAARAAGAAGLILTLDWSFAHRRDAGSPRLPERVSVRELARQAPAGLRRPGWLLRYARRGRLPALTVPNLARPGEPAPPFFTAYARWSESRSPTWDDVAWLAREWGGVAMLKGIARPDDARRAVDAGMTAVSVSNHGGNNLDGTPPAIALLPAVAAAVGGQVEVLLDGGVRCGSDVAKALALGARAVMIGRPCLWGLAAGGQAGVERVLDILRDGLAASLSALGRAGVAGLAPADLLIPPGFAVPPGCPLTRSGGR